MKYGFEGYIFKCRSWPTLAKQPINVYFVTIWFCLLNHLSNETRNEDVQKLQLRAKFQTAMVSCSRII